MVRVWFPKEFHLLIENNDLPVKILAVILNMTMMADNISYVIQGWCHAVGLVCF